MATGITGNATLNVTANTAQMQQQINAALARFKNINISLGLKNDVLQPLGRITGQVSELNKSLDAANARVIAFGASAGSIFLVEKALSGVVTATVEVQKELANINALLNLSSNDLSGFSQKLFSVARNTAQSFSVAAEAATEFSRQGLDVEETLKRTNAALVLTRLSGLDATKSVEALTATMNSFSEAGLNAAEIVNKLANVDAGFAVSSADLANAIQRVGSSASDAGVSFDELIALVTTAQQVTARGGSVIGNSLKTIFTRLQRGKTQGLLESLGISTKDESGNMRGMIDMLKDLAKTYDTLGQVQKNAVAEQVGGVFQINVLKAALKDLGSEYSIYDRALQTSIASQDQATQRNEKLNQTISAMSQQALTNVQQAAAAIGKIAFEPKASGFLKTFNSIFEQINNADTDGVGAKIGTGLLTGLSNFISGPGVVMLGGIAINLFRKFAGFAKDSFKELLGLNTAAKERGALESSILDTLVQERSILDSLLKGNVSQVDAAAKLTTLFKDQALLLSQQESHAKAIAAIMSGGFKMGNIGVGPTASKAIPLPKTASIGFIPAFAEAQGALSHGYKPGRIQETIVHDGTGKSQKVITNSAEKIYDFRNASGHRATMVIPPNGFGEDTNVGGFAAGGYSPSMESKFVSGRNRGQVAWMRDYLRKNKGRIPESMLSDQRFMTRLGELFAKKYGDDQGHLGIASGFIPNFVETPGAYKIGDLKGKSSGLLSGLFDVGEHNVNDTYNTPHIERIKLGKSVEQYTRLALGEISDIRSKLPAKLSRDKKVKFIEDKLNSIYYRGKKLTGWTNKIKPESLLDPSKDTSNASNIKGFYGEVDTAAILSKSSAVKLNDLQGADFHVKGAFSSPLGVSEVDFLAETKVVNKNISDNVLVAKALQYAGSTAREKYKNKHDNTIPLKSIKLFHADYAKKSAAGGFIPNFANVIGYLDGDVLANPANAAIVDEQIKKLGIKGGAQGYHKYLTDLASKRRASGGLKRWSAIYGVPGSGKSTKMLGGKPGQGGSKLNPRLPILTPEDISRVDEIIDTRASVVGTAELFKAGGGYTNLDRHLTLSTATQEAKDVVIQNRINRQANLLDPTRFGRDDASASGAYLDSSYIEAVATSVLGPKKAILLDILKGNKLRRRSPENYPQIKNIKGGALTLGAFSPFTKGHSEIAKKAQAMGLTPEQMIFLISNDGGTLDRNDQHSWRTLLFPQKLRADIAKASLPAGANVVRASKDWGASLPSLFPLGDNAYGKMTKGGSAIVGDDKGQSSIDRYVKYGLSPVVLSRNGVSGTGAREAIMAGDMSRVRELMEPGGADIISKILPQIQNRNSILPEIFGRIDARIDPQLAEVEAQLAKYPKMLTAKVKAENPDFEAKVLELRAKRDSLKRQKQSLPKAYLSRLSKFFPSKYGYQYAGGFFPNFAISREALMRMAEQNTSPREAAIAREKLARMGGGASGLSNNPYFKKIAQFQNSVYGSPLEGLIDSRLSSVKGSMAGQFGTEKYYEAMYKAIKGDSVLNSIASGMIPNFALSPAQKASLFRSNQEAFKKEFPDEYAGRVEARDLGVPYSKLLIQRASEVNKAKKIKEKEDNTVFSDLSNRFAILTPDGARGPTTLRAPLRFLGFEGLPDKYTGSARVMKGSAGRDDFKKIAQGHLNVAINGLARDLKAGQTDKSGQFLSSGQTANVMGNLFEGAINKIFGLNVVENASLDVPSTSATLSQFFGIKPGMKADLKKSAEGSSAGNMLKKLVTNDPAYKKSVADFFAEKQMANKKRAAAGFLPNFAYFDKVMGLEESMSGSDAKFYTSPFPHIRNSSQPTFTSAMADHGGLSQALRDSVEGQKKAGLLSSGGFVPNFADDTDGIKAGSASDFGVGGLLAGLQGLAFTLMLTRKEGDGTKASFLSLTQGLKGLFTSTKQLEKATKDLDIANTIARRYKYSVGAQNLQKNAADRVSSMQGNIAAYGNLRGRVKPFLKNNAFALGGAAQIVAPQIGEFIGNDKTSVGRGIKSLAAGVGNVAGMAGTGFMLGGPVGAVVGGVAGAAMEAPSIIEAFNDKTPEFESSLAKATKSLNDFSLGAQKVLSSLSNMSQMDLTTAAGQKGFQKSFNQTMDEAGKLVMPAGAMDDLRTALASGNNAQVQEILSKGESKEEDRVKRIESGNILYKRMKKDSKIDLNTLDIKNNQEAELKELSANFNAGFFVDKNGVETGKRSVLVGARDTLKGYGEKEFTYSDIDRVVRSKNDKDVKMSADLKALKDIMEVVAEGKYVELEVLGDSLQESQSGFSALANMAEALNTKIDQTIQEMEKNRVAQELATRAAKNKQLAEQKMNSALTIFAQNVEAKANSVKRSIEFDAMREDSGRAISEFARGSATDVATNRLDNVIDRKNKFGDFRMQFASALGQDTSKLESQMALEKINDGLNKEKFGVEQDNRNYIANANLERNDSITDAVRTEKLTSLDSIKKLVLDETEKAKSTDPDVMKDSVERLKMLGEVMGSLKDDKLDPSGLSSFKDASFAVKSSKANVSDEYRKSLLNSISATGAERANASALNIEAAKTKADDVYQIKVAESNAKMNVSLDALNAKAAEQLKTQRFANTLLATMRDVNTKLGAAGGFEANLKPKEQDAAFQSVLEAGNAFRASFGANTTAGQIKTKLENAGRGKTKVDKNGNIIDQSDNVSGGGQASRQQSLAYGAYRASLASYIPGLRMDTKDPRFKAVGRAINEQALEKFTAIGNQAGENGDTELKKQIEEITQKLLKDGDNLSLGTLQSAKAFGLLNEDEFKGGQVAIKATAQRELDEAKNSSGPDKENRIKKAQEALDAVNQAIGNPNSDPVVEAIQQLPQEIADRLKAALAPSLDKEGKLKAIESESPSLKLKADNTKDDGFQGAISSFEKTVAELKTALTALANAMEAARKGTPQTVDNSVDVAVDITVQQSMDIAKLKQGIIDTVKSLSGTGPVVPPSATPAKK